MKSLFSRPGVGYVLAQLAVVAVLALAAITVVRTHGPAISHDLRETLLWLTPERALRGAVVLALVMGAWSLGAGMSPPRARITGRVRLPVVALVGLIIVTAATFRLLLVRAATEPRVLGDELIYTGLAKSLALDGHLRFRGEPDLAHSLLYPLVLSPAYALAGDGARAFDVTKTINVILFTSAAIPAYLLARRVAGAGLAVAVAALVAFEPWSAYGSLVMTESLFLPAFTTFVLLLARMLEHCSRGRQLVVLVSLLALMAIRPQAYVLVAAVVGAIGISGVRAPPLTRALRAYRFLLVALGSGILLAILALGAGAAVPGGGAGDVAKTLLDPVALLKWSLWNLAVYELALGVVALVVFPLALYGLVRSPTDRVRATGIAMLTSSLAILLSVAAVSASPFGLDILHERYLFYVTPLVLVGLAYWLQAGVVPQRRVMWGAGVAAIALAVTLPTDQIARANNVDSPTATWVRTLDETWQDVPTKLVVVGVAALGALVLVRFRKATAPMLAVAVSFTAIVCWLDYSSPFGPGQDPQLAWVDRALPRGGRASIVHLGLSRPDQPCAADADREQQGLVVWTEFFNTRVDRVFHIGEQVERDNLQSPALTVGPGGVVLQNGRLFAPAYAVLDSRQPVVGRQLSRIDLASLGTQYQDGASLTIWKVDPPLRFLAHAQPLPPRADGREC